ncbi:MAG: hypothetical protein J6J53_05775, partial [Muribaculaceae bacterium]|nr:hypothetical protein [Muribaculaceae bacterium]
GYHAWIIGYRDETMAHIGLAPSSRETLLNGSLECELREYIIFDGDKRSFKAAGGKLESNRTDTPRLRKGPRLADDRKRPFDRKRDHERDDERAERRFRPEAEPENPLAKRRNPKAVEAIVGKQPSISPRKGWRRKDND